MTQDTDRLLDLVRQALVEIDDRPVDVTTRRVVRLASMLGETELAVWLGLELKPTGGHPPANAEDTRRLMADPSLWGDREGPAEGAMTLYFGNRRIESGPSEGKIRAQGLAELETWLALISKDEELASGPGWLENHLEMLAIRERVRHSCFSALCAWERRLTYANTNEQIFERFRAAVDANLAAGAPMLLDQFSAVYRRLREAGSNPEGMVSEELAQAVTTCRRILKAVADHLLPGKRGAESDGGNSLDDAAYKNRIYEFVKANVDGDGAADAVRAAVGGVFERFSALDKLANKGVHAEIGVHEAEMCAINTYIVAGELLRLQPPN